MQFKHPELLWALFLLLIPIIVHLFQLRRFQKVWFTNVAFLKEIKLQTRKSSTLKKWLTLITRLLILTFLIIAFAEPFIPKATSGALASEGETVIYLDNSFSMQAKGKNGPLLQRAVRDVLAGSNGNARITLFTNSDTYVNTTIAEIRNTLVSLPYSNQQLSYEEAYLRGVSYFSDKVNTMKNFIFISDFQMKNKSLEIKEQPGITTHFIQTTPENTRNISIDSVYLSRNEAGTIRLITKVSSSDETGNITASLFDNQKVIAKTATGITANSTSEMVFTLPENSHLNGYISVTDDGLEYDNTLYLSIQTPEKTNVLLINNTEDGYLKRLFSAPEFNVTEQSIGQLDFNSIPQQNTIILNQIDDLSSGLISTLQNFSKNGGSVVVIPSAGANIEDYNNLMESSGIRMDDKRVISKEITSIHFSHPLFNGVFDQSVNNFEYPMVRSYYPLSGGNTALSLEDQNPFLTSAGNWYVFAAPLDLENSNFQNSPLIVPSLYNMAKNSIHLPTLYYTIGQKNTIEVTTQLAEDTVLEISQEGENAFIPMQESLAGKVKIMTEETPDVSGNYQAVYKNQTLYNLSYNYNRNESNLTYYRLADFNLPQADTLSNVLDDIKSDSEDSGLWKWFVIFALLFLGTEMFILKFLK